MTKPTVVVPVYNGVAEVARCLESLSRWPLVSVVLVDDASSDARIAPLLADFASKRADVRIISAPQNRGFIASANAGAAAVQPNSDILLLNADTQVTTDALHEMAAAIGSRDDAAICCPLSNNATFLSAPRYQQEGGLPEGLDAEGFSGLLRECSPANAALEIPTAVGFCMWIRREAWRAFGPLDAAYGRGYGEDDDFAQRVRAGGRTVVCAPRAFVFHQGHASFGVDADVMALRRTNGALLAQRWPRYRDEVGSFCRANPLRPLLEKLWHLVLAWPARRTGHILHVVRAWPRYGGLRDRLLQLARSTRGFANHTIVVPTEDRGAWVDAIDGEVESGIRTVGLPAFPQRFASFLAASPATLVHFHGQSWLPEQVSEAARRARRATLTTSEDGLNLEGCAQAYELAAMA